MTMNTLITFAIVCFLAILPPTYFVIHNPPNPYWQWMVMIAGFMGFFTIHMKTHWLVSFIAIGGFLNCFFSAIPYVSFTSYISLCGCCYLYIFASRIKDWDIILKGLQIVALLTGVICFMQMIHHDPLLNFGMKETSAYGIIGQHMQAGSFAIVLTALLLSVSKWFIIFPVLTAFFCHSSWTLLTAGVGVFILKCRYGMVTALIFLTCFIGVFIFWDHSNHKIDSNALVNEDGRMAVWKRSFQFSNERPLTGWGIGTFKDIFSPVCGLYTQAWRSDHNFIVQLCFEIGYVFTGCLLVALGCLLWTLYKHNLWMLLSGFVMLIVDGLVHFPDRMIQTVPLIVLLFAYTQFTIKRYT